MNFILRMLVDSNNYLFVLMRPERKLRKNLTFRNGEAVHLNACVGNNSGIDNRNGYAWGFAVSVKILLSAALNGSYADVLDGERDPQIDGLIYPIAFCARHHIELFLKREISYVSAIRGPSRTPPNKHDLGILWKDFSDTCASTDRYLFSCAEPLAEYVLDFTEIDPTGQTFRYAAGKKNIAHLAQISVINLYAFAERFYEMIALIENFEIAREVMEWEYAQGTYTKKLSRGELSDLTNTLPKRADWAGSARFLEVRNEFRQRYKLSSNDFAKAIKIVESHREFSARLGVELPIKELQCDVFSRLSAIRAGTVDTAIVSDTEWAALFAICETGRAQTYGEAYDVELNDAIDAIQNGRIDRVHTVRTIVGANGRFLKGLNRMGQITLAAHFEEHFKSLSLAGNA